MEMINFNGFLLYCKAGANQCQKQNIAVQHTRSADAKEHEQICHFRRLDNVKILQLTCFIELELQRRQSLLGLVLVFFFLNHSGNTHAIFLFESYDDYALVQLYQLKIFAVLNRPLKAKQAVLLWALSHFP